MSRQSLLLIALLLSLAVNLLIAGVVIGRAGGPPRDPPPMAWAAQQLSPEVQRRVRTRMRDQMEEIRPLREELRGAHLALRRAVSAEPYDPEALAAALARKRQAESRYQALVHNSLAEISADLTREQRVALLRAAMQREQSGRRAPNRSPDAHR